MPKVDGKEPILLRLLKKRKKGKKKTGTKQKTIAESMKLSEKFVKENP